MTNLKATGFPVACDMCCRSLLLLLLLGVARWATPKGQCGVRWATPKGQTTCFQVADDDNSSAKSTKWSDLERRGERVEVRQLAQVRPVFHHQFQVARMVTPCVAPHEQTVE